MASNTSERILYEPDESPPLLATIVLGFQTVMGAFPSLAAFVAITTRIGEQPSGYTSWAVFAAFLASGIVMIIQSFRVWRFGAGYTLLVGPSSAFIVICAAALLEGGPALMSALVLVSTLFHFAFVAKLSLLRRVITPTVAGTTLMLLAGTAVSALLETLSDIRAGSSLVSAAGVAALTLGIMVVMRMYAPPKLQQWSPAVAIGVGAIVAAALGLFDFQGVIDAPLLGTPGNAWPGIELNPGVTFWALLPGFVVVTLASSVNALGEGVAIQRVSWRRPRATDFRVIQGTLNAVGLGNLLSAALGTMPMALLPANVARTMLTGVAARRVGIVGGIFFIIVALLPKVVALLAAVPSSVLASYLTVVLGLLFAEGLRMVLRDGMDGRKALAVGTSFWIGMGFHHGVIFPELLTGMWGTLLGNGMTTGSIAVIGLSLMIELPAMRRRRLVTSLDAGSLPEIDQFLLDFASKGGWNEADTARLRSAGEETLLSLTQSDADEPGSARRLTVSARRSSGVAELEFIAASDQENLEDRIAYLNELTEVPNEEDIALRLLRRYASSVEHRKYYGIDIIAVRVEQTRVKI